MSARGIEFHDLHKSFGATRVLRGITLDVRPGEFLTLLGASGCGKSTLLRLIAGFDTPDRGGIVIGGQEITALPPRARDVAMVFQSYALYPHMTVRENIAVPLEMRRLSGRQRQPGAGLFSARVRALRREIGAEVERVAGVTGLEALLDRRPAQLSGGQRQRVAVARAMVRQPAVFLMDEPLSNLDAKLRVQMREEICELHRRSGITFIYVTHDQTEAMAMSDRIAVMEGGELRQCDTPETIYNRPRHLSVARFLGAVAINEIPVELRGGKVIAGGVVPGLHVEGPDGPATLAVRPEALCPVGPGVPGIVLPVVQVEFTGAEVMIRCDGRALGAGALRVQLRADECAALGAAAQVGGRLPLQVRAAQAMIFDGNGRRRATRVFPACREVADDRAL